MKTPNHPFLSNRHRWLTHTGVFALLASLVTALTSARSQTFTANAGTSLSWNLSTNWNPATIPNAVDASATFLSPTGTESVTTGTTVDTVGTINETDNGTFVLSLLASTGGGLNFSASSGNAAFNISGNGTAVNVLSAATTLTSTLDLTITDTAVTSFTGALSLTGSISGSGGFIKDGDGTASITTTAKTYTGATTINAGILRLTATGEPTNTSGVTVNSGGQLRLDSSAGVYTLGVPTGTLITLVLNGAGDTNLTGTGTSSSNGAGALDYTATAGAGSLANPIQLASATSISATASAAGASLALNGVVSGTGALTKVGVGTIILSAANTYSGGTTISAGTLYANGSLSGTNSATGTGAVTVNAGTLGGTGTISGAVTVNSGGIVQGGLSTLNGAANGTLTLSSLLTLNTGSAIQIAIGSNFGHSTLATSGVTFASGQVFNIIETAITTTGTYPNIISGLTSDPGTESTWVANGSYGGFMANFTYDTAGGIDLNVTAVPEPTTVLGGGLLIAAAAWSQRRRLRGGVAA